jgi:hypothetical protein
MKSINKQETAYFPPQIQITTLRTEGIVCASKRSSQEEWGEVDLSSL